MPDIRNHTRVNDILLGPLERPALKWFCKHMPAWVSPDVLTGVGVFGAFLILISYALTNVNKNFLWLACFGFFINWFGDSLDGSLARYRKIQRPYYGFFIDHTVDALCEVLIFFGLGLSPYIRFDFACLALTGYLLLSVLVYVKTCVSNEFKISFGRLGPTEIRVIAVLASILIYFIGSPSFVLASETFTIYDVIVIAIAILLMTFFVWSVIKEGRKFSRQDNQRRKEVFILGEPES